MAVLPPLVQLLSPATRFLLHAVCADGSDAPEPGLSTAALAAEARRQQVEGLLLHWAGRFAPATLRDELSAELAATQKLNAVAALELVAETRKLAAQLADEGIRAIAVKGPLLAKAYYGDYGLRHAGDVDLLVDTGDVAAADRALRTRGYLRTKPRTELSRVRFQLYLRTQHELGYVRADGNVSVELHWRYGDPPEIAPCRFAELWQRSVTHDIAGTTVRALSNRDTFVHLAVHGALDGWSRLKWIADLPRVLATLQPFELAALEKEARAAGHSRALTLALALAGRPVSAPWVEAAMPRMLRRLSGEERPTLLRKLATHREDWRYFDAIADNRRMRRALGYSRLIMPADFDRISLPDAMTPVLPFLAQCRRAYGYLGPRAP